MWWCVFFFNDTATTEIYTLSLHDALPISGDGAVRYGEEVARWIGTAPVPPESLPPAATLLLALLEREGSGRTIGDPATAEPRSEEHTSELQSRLHLVCRLLLEKKKWSRQC